MSKKLSESDPFAAVRAATLKHREKHGCSAWPYDNGPLLGALAGAAGAKRILKLGCALGYTSLSLANGAPKSRIDTVEHGEAKVVIADREFSKVVKTLKGPYDVAFFDGGAPIPAVHETLRKLLRPRGLLITANLNHGGTADVVLAALLDGKRWLTAFLDEERETGISIKL